MKKNVFLAMLLSGTLAIHAADYQYLTIESTDGSVVSLTAIGLNITYADGMLVATAPGTGTDEAPEVATIDVAKVSRMYFSDTKTESEGSEATAISTIAAGQSAIGTAREVYDLSGRRAADGSSGKGVYVVKTNETTRKVQVK